MSQKFDPIDTLHKKEDYLKAFRFQFGQLNDGDLMPFWFYDGIAMDKGCDAVVVWGKKVKPEVLKALKTESSARGEGTCFREGGVLKITLASGRMP